MATDIRNKTQMSLNLPLKIYLRHMHTFTQRSEDVCLSIDCNSKIVKKLCKYFSFGLVNM